MLHNRIKAVLELVTEIPGPFVTTGPGMQLLGVGLQFLGRGEVVVLGFSLVDVRDAE